MPNKYVDKSSAIYNKQNEKLFTNIGILQSIINRKPNEQNKTNVN